MTCGSSTTLLNAAAIASGSSTGAVSPAPSSTSGIAERSDAIYSVLMMQNDFIAPNINVTELDEGAKGFDIVLEKRDAKLNTVMSNSFGFGGVNACLIFKKWDT